MKTTTIHRPLISLHLPTVIALLIAFAKSVVQALTGNPHFPNPAPTLAALTAAINDLEVAETTAMSKAKGAATVRNDKRVLLVSLLSELKAYVQKIADATPENAAAIIQSAAMSVRKHATPKPRVFAIAQGPVSGSVKVVTRSAGPRVAYDWQWSTDGGKTWQLAPSTMQAKTSMSGLPVGGAVSFRYRTVAKTGVSDWSEPTSLLVK